jgi:hypothetical protein
MVGMRGSVLALFALLACMPEARSVPTRFLEGELGMPAVRPPPIRPTTRGSQLKLCLLSWMTPRPAPDPYPSLL